MSGKDFTVGEYGTRVYQAQGMVSVQAACSIPDALILMKDHADATHSTLDEIADSVLDRVIRFGK